MLKRQPLGGRVGEVTFHSTYTLLYSLDFNHARFTIEWIPGNHALESMCHQGHDGCRLQEPGLRSPSPCPSLSTRALWPLRSHFLLWNALSHLRLSGELLFSSQHPTRTPSLPATHVFSPLRAHMMGTTVFPESQYLSPLCLTFLSHC